MAPLQFRRAVVYLLTRTVRAICGYYNAVLRQPLRPLTELASAK